MKTNKLLFAGCVALLLTHTAWPGISFVGKYLHVKSEPNKCSTIQIVPNPGVTLSVKHFSTANDPGQMRVQYKAFSAHSASNHSFDWAGQDPDAHYRIYCYQGGRQEEQQEEEYVQKNCKDILDVTWVKKGKPPQTEIKNLSCDKVLRGYSDLNMNVVK